MDDAVIYFRCKNGISFFPQFSPAELYPSECKQLLLQPFFRSHSVANLEKEKKIALCSFYYKFLSKVIRARSSNLIKKYRFLITCRTVICMIVTFKQSKI